LIVSCRNGRERERERETRLVAQQAVVGRPRASEPGGQAAAGREVPATSDDALRLALKLAVDAGEYERAAVVLDELRRTTNRVGIVQREGKP
jgi:hypothetical protein